MNNQIAFTRMRLEKIHLVNFKGVENGTIEFNCFKNPIEKNTQADILGLYGQNGSGKTTLLEALSIVKNLMTGYQLPLEYADLISQSATHARIEVGFQILNEDNSVLHLEYGFSFRKAKFLREISYNTSKVNPLGIAKSLLIPFPASILFMDSIVNTERKSSSSTIYQVVIFDEVLTMGGMFCGSNVRLGPIFDARSKEDPFLPKAKLQEFFPEKPSQASKELEKFKTRAYNNAQSFIFSNDVLQLMEEHKQEDYTDYVRLMIMLRLYASENLVIFGTSNDKYIPIYTASQVFGISKKDSTLSGDENDYKKLQKALEGISLIFNQLIPGMSIESSIQRDVSTEDTIVDYNSTEKTIKVYSVRNGIRIPIAKESTGIIRLISSVGLIAYAFSNRNATVAIDEIDSGVYEYLLGSLLQMFEKNGVGQLIFTCHNLMPLEMLNKRFIYFTSTKPNNRYIKLKNVRNENNLRDLYLKLLKKDEELYSSGTDSMITNAFQNAGDFLR